MKIITTTVMLHILLFTSQVIANETSPKSTIERFVSYSNYGSGDVFVSLEYNGSICNYGYYLNKEDQGFEANYSMLISAYHAYAKVILIGLDKGEKWSGSGNTVCKLYSVELVK
ncbi:hypothetical protein PUND_b0487 [Pseudoalteromonas undina]|uniref:Uncharacterized protein n=1 Tax=Pseudoalteromonas undina TaxID=43660 RepID=A0ABN0NIC4_9GAMM|nr:hypothetical protein [Pseudoalteromonas undina]KAF7763149.1 hypothetical protein PUND_b0487 [Pseudoalteromonas undina]